MFMGGAEQLEVGTPWGWNSTAVKVTVTNAGGSTVTITKARVNNTEITFTTPATLQPKTSTTLTVDLTGQPWTFQQGYQYTIVIITQNNREFPTTGTYTP
ncbi:MAG: hypothetical protein C0193_01830 [Candidatus Bathyarchaeota archaeon]|nr:MAG: hypothetical protein C0193_01830 [Candidatus Bathyarchaeota archaeon]